MSISRREFLGVAIAAGGTSSLLLVGSGCGSDDDSGGGSAGTGAGSSTGGTGSGLSCGADIAANHSHSMTVSAADVSAGTDKTYNIKGGATHDHTVILTASHFATLAGGGSVSVTSSDTNAHSHPITVTCA